MALVTGRGVGSDGARLVFGSFDPACQSSIDYNGPSFEKKETTCLDSDSKEYLPAQLADLNAIGWEFLYDPTAVLPPEGQDDTWTLTAPLSVVGNTEATFVGTGYLTNGNLNFDTSGDFVTNSYDVEITTLPIRTIEVTP